MATLLLTLSNLMFLAPITLSVYRCLLVEASVYAYTMFFSTVGPPALVGMVGRSGRLLTTLPHSSIMPVTSPGRRCCVYSTTTRCNTVTSWVLECPSGSPSSAWHG